MIPYIVTLDPREMQCRAGMPVGGRNPEAAVKRFVRENCPPALPILPRQCREITAYVWRLPFPETVYTIQCVATTITRGQKRPKVKII
jgi:hypothetical protein